MYFTKEFVENFRKISQKIWKSSNATDEKREFFKESVDFYRNRAPRKCGLPSLPPEQQEMPLIEHLLELRNRLLKMVLAVIICFAAIYPFANELYLLISQPLRDLLPVGQTMIATDITSPFFAPLKLALVLAVFVAIPVILYQLWSFIAPGLYAHEKKLAFPLLFTSVVLFYLGAAFAYYVVFPLVFGFFTAIGPEGIV